MSHTPRDQPPAVHPVLRLSASNSSAGTVEALEVRGGPLAVLRLRGVGPRVLLVAGYSGSKEDFRLLVGPLAAAGYDVVALDQRGQFQSPGPASADYTTDGLGADVLALLDRLGEPDAPASGPVHLVGHSFGGLVARAAVLARPLAFRSLTLLSSGPDGLAGPRIDVLPLLVPLLEQGMPAVVAAMDQLNAADAAWLALDASTQVFLRERMLESSPHALLATADALRFEPDRVDALRATDVPVLVLHGADDDAWSPALQAQMAQRLRARHVVVPGAAHSPAVEQPRLTAEALVAFWAATERQAPDVEVARAVS